MRWGRERLQAVRRRRAPKLEAGFYRCQGWAGCIIATIWQPELLSQESLVEVEDELRVRCALKPALCPLRSHNEPFRKENACQNDHQVRYSISFLSRVDFWRSTALRLRNSSQSASLAPAAARSASSLESVFDSSASRQQSRASRKKRMCSRMACRASSRFPSFSAW